MAYRPESCALRVWIALLLSTLFWPRSGSALECIDCSQEQRLIVDAACDTITVPRDWQKRSPFEAPPEKLPRALQSYCLLTAGPGVSRPAPLLFAVDDPIVFPAASPLAPVVWTELRARFLQGTGRLAALPVGAEPFHRTEVAIIDDADDDPARLGRPGSGVMQHGRTMGAIVDELACPSGQRACAVALYNHRALGCDGGRSGTRGALANAIHQSVLAWKLRESTRVEEVPLVINLSLGYAEDENTGTTSIVQSAIQFAVCHGALVIGAAGNRAPDGGGVGPLFPAAFEAIATVSSCADHDDGDATRFVSSPSSRPLIHAVFGAAPFGAWSALPNTRPGGRAKLAAAAFHAIAADPLSTTSASTPVFTGTSVAAAVMSATAGVLWAYRPELSPRDVADAIWDSGIELDGFADFGEGGGGAAIRMVNLCAALRDTCAAGNQPECTAAAALSCPTPSAAPTTWPLGQLASEMFGGTANNTCFATTGPNMSCTVFAAPPPAEGCPVRSSNIVGPQPGELGCSACAIHASTRKLFLGIESTYDDVVIPVAVRFKIAGGTTITPYAGFDGPGLTAGQSAQLVLQWTGNGADQVANLTSGAVAYLGYKTGGSNTTYWTTIAWQ